MLQAQWRVAGVPCNCGIIQTIYSSQPHNLWMRFNEYRVRGKKKKSKK